jgi:hypothetical protein
LAQGIQVLFFVEIGTRQVHVGVIAYPTGAAAANPPSRPAVVR